MAFKIYLPDTDTTLDDEFDRKDQAHAYATSPQMLSDHPDIDKGTTYQVVEE